MKKPPGQTKKIRRPWDALLCKKFLAFCIDCIHVNFFEPLSCLVSRKKFSVLGMRCSAKNFLRFVGRMGGIAMEVIYFLLEVLIAILLIGRFCKDFFAIGDWRKALQGTAVGVLLLMGMQIFL